MDGWMHGWLGGGWMGKTEKERLTYWYAKTKSGGGARDAYIWGDFNTLHSIQRHDI